VESLNLQHPNCKERKMRMKKNQQRRMGRSAIAWLLTLAMMFSMVGALPIVASAEEVHSTGYTYGVDEAVAEERIEKILTSLYIGEYPTGHMQGFAIDDEMKYLYASFTTKLAKVDVETGEVVGVVHNWSGHLGDMAYYDGRVYGSLEYKGANSFYIAVFDCDKIVGDVDHTVCMRTMYLPEVSKDYGDTIDDVKYAYGCSGIDGVAFGKIPGSNSDEIVMMVAYGIFTDNATNVNDRDYQVLLQYDLSSFLESDGQGGTQLKAACNDVLNQSNHHKKGPEHEDKYFIYTGNTNYGIQNLEYDAKSGNYCMAVYVGSCPEFPNYKIFYMDGSSVPEVQDLIMAPERFEAYKALPNTNPGCTHMAQGKVVALADNNGSSTGEATLAYEDCDPGFGDDTYRVWGSDSIPRSPSTGLDHIYGDYFYISQSGGGLTGGQIGYAHLYEYDRDTDTFTAINREAPAAPAKKLLSYSMDAGDLYTKNGVTYMTNGASEGYDAVVEGTKASVGVDGTANGSLAFNGWNYPAAPDQLYLDEDTIDYLNSEFGKASYSYSYSFWAKVASANNTDGNFIPYAGFYREDGTYVGVFEQRWRNSLKYVVNGIGTAAPGSNNAGTDWAKNVGNPTTSNPGDNPGDYITSPENGVWNFYTVTEKNGAVTIYENGARKLSFNVTANHFAAEPIADFIIGGPSAKLWLDMNNRGRLIGSVDDVTIYSGILTPDQVAAEYAKVTTKETSGVPNVTAADKAEAPSDDVVYVTYDLTADEGEDLVMDMGASVAGLQIPGLTAGTDYVAEGTKVTVKATWLAAQEPGKIEVTAGGVNVCLTVTDVKVPVLSYSMDKASVTGNVVKDSSVYGVDAVANNINTFNSGSKGAANGSVFFNGHDYKNPTYIKLATDDAAWLNSVLTDGYTINFWAKAQAENGNKMVFAGLFGDDARPLGVVETNDGDGLNTQIDGILNVQVNAAKAGTQTAQNARAASVAEVGEWAMYTATYDKASGLLKLYVNGAVAASAPADDDILGEISQLFIGHAYKKYYYVGGNRDWTTRGGFYGLMDNFEVYNYALSEEEIGTLAGGGAIQPAIKTDPIVHWTMDAGTLNTDGTMTDKSKNELTSYFQNVTPVAGVDGKENGALYFDGSSDADEFSRVWLSDEGIKTLNEKIGDKITVAFWMKPDFASRGENYPYTGTWTPVGGVFGESDHRFLMVAEYRYGQMCYCAQSGGDKHIPGLSASGWKDDQWYYVVMTYDSAVTETLSSKSNSYHRLFVMSPDGTVNEYAGSRPFTNAAMHDKITHLEFGGQYAKGHWTDTNVRGRYIGAIDDIKVYNVAVNKDDVVKLAAARPVTVPGSYTAPQKPAPEVSSFEPAVITFDKSEPADVTFTAKDSFGAVTSVTADNLFDGECVINGKTVTIKADYLMQRQPGAVEFTVTSASGSETVSVYVVNSSYPVLYYPMDKADLVNETADNGIVSGTIADASGNGLDLISTGITTTAADKDNTANAATWFDSYREHNISYAALDQAGMDVFKTLVKDEVTFSFWHKSDRISSNYMPVLGLYAEDDRPVLLAEFFAGSGGERSGKNQTTTPAFTATPDNSVALAEGSLRASSTVAMNSTWHHYVMTYNNATGAAVLYVDGAKVGEATLSAGQLDDAATFEIGALANADYYAVGASTGRESGMSLYSHGRLHGHLDEVKVYGVALGAAEVTALYNAGVGEALPEDVLGLKTISAIELTALPTKTDYAVNEALDVTGGKVTITYTDSYTNVMDLTADMVSGFKSDKGVLGLELTVSYTHRGVTKTDTFVVDVIKELESIEVNGLDGVILQKDAQLDLTGATVTLSYNDETEDEIALTAGMISGFDSSAVGANTITVTYEGKTDQVELTIVDKAALEVAVDGTAELKKAQYTKKSWKALEAALAAAQAVIDDPASTQADIDAAEAAVLAAVDGLRKGGDSGPVTTGPITDPIVEPEDPVVEDKDFEDVADTDWFAAAVDYVVAEGLFSGTSKTTFSPYVAMSRSMLAVVLHSMEGKPEAEFDGSFTDVKAGDWYAEAVLWAAGEGIVAGYDNGAYGANDPLTREQLAAILWKYAQYLKLDVSAGEDTNILSYDDAADIDEWAIPAMQWACAEGIISGKSESTLDPNGKATRCEVAQMMMNFCKLAD